MSEPWRVLGVVVVGGLLAFAPVASPADGLKPGDTLDKSNWEKAQGMLPEEILRHYKDGEYVNKIVDWPDTQYNFPPDFKAGSEGNRGKYTTSPEGTILEKATGKQPDFVLGHPFPTIDPADPHAAAEILWNHFYRTWYFGNQRSQSQLNWLNPTGLDRRADVDVRFGYYDGVPEDERPTSNGDNFLYRTLSYVTGPADLNGTAALTWRYRDGTKRDSTWAYVPALRRVRATSPANRSDGFLGSDESQDDGPFFDGKVEDFDWKVVGQVDQLRISEETNLKDKTDSRWIDGVGWDAVWPDIAFIGYQDPAWKGVAWAPVGAATLSSRPFWVIEGVPHDKYYLYGKIQLFIDKISYQGAWNRKFGWRGELLAVHQVMGWNPLPSKRPTGKVDYLQGGNQAFQCIENIKMNRATVAGIKSGPSAVFASRVHFESNIFDVDALSRAGK